MTRHGVSLSQPLIWRIEGQRRRGVTNPFGLPGGVEPVWVQLTSSCL
jgi:hypothetical protein